MELLFLIVLFVVAALYSSVGHGGASGYLALMAIFGFEQYLMKSSALTLNLVVSGISFYSFYRQGHMRFKILIPFVIGSIPMAFLGASIHIKPDTYKIILGILLILVVLRLLIKYKNDHGKTKDPVIFLSVIIGAVIGLFSGMIGIGGGIILSPVLLLLKWSNIKETAGISSLFIFLNSISGLIGLSFNQRFEPTDDILVWAIVGLLGGYIGAYFSSKKLAPEKIKIILSQVLILASIKLLFF